MGGREGQESEGHVTVRWQSRASKLGPEEPRAPALSEVTALLVHMDAFHASPALPLKSDWE